MTAMIMTDIAEVAFASIAIPKNSPARNGNANKLRKSAAPADKAGFGCLLFSTVFHKLSTASDNAATATVQMLSHTDMNAATGLRSPSANSSIAMKAAAERMTLGIRYLLLRTK